VSVLLGRQSLPHTSADVGIPRNEQRASAECSKTSVSGWDTPQWGSEELCFTNLGDLCKRCLRLERTNAVKTAPSGLQR
jgi:hypothetical protein